MGDAGGTIHNTLRHDGMGESVMENVWEGMVWYVCVCTCMCVCERGLRRMGGEEGRERGRESLLYVNTLLTSLSEVRFSI